MERFKGKVVLVTGAASGIGRAAVKRLVAEGAKVVATDLAKPVLAQLVEDGGGVVAASVHDVTQEEEWRRAIASATEFFGSLHGLVNAAGILMHGTIEDTSLADWRRMMDVNVYGTFLGCRLAMPLIAQSGGGSIVNISSIAGIEGTPDIFAYGASKGAVRSLTKAVALEGARRNPQVRCNSIHPGVIATSMVANYFAERDKPAEVERAWRKSQPTGEFGEPEDVAAMIAFLASDESAFVTGAEYVVDGAAMA